MFHRTALSFCLLLAASGALAGPSALTEEEEFFNLERASLEEILNIKTSVASRSSMSLRQTPGLVTVLTREEIQAYGARDLADILKLLPELDIGADVQGNLGLGVRGNWGNEGKVLLLWDGQVCNEPLYGTLQLDRFPVDQIETVEVIRGPGSVLYGGYAGLAVVNIRSISARALSGGSAVAAYGQGARARARYYAGASYGGVFGGTELAAKVFAGEAQRSDRRYKDLSGFSYGMNGNSRLRPRRLNLSAARGGASARLIIDNFALTDRDQFDSALSTGPGKVEFPTVLAEASYALGVSDELQLTPALNYSRSMAWLEKDEHFTYDKKTERVTGSLTARYSRTEALELLAGAEAYHDAVKVDEITAPDSRYADGREKVSYDNHAFFGQAVLRGDRDALAAGTRYDKHSKYGASLVPRLAYTRQDGPFNLKVIYSRAFKAPTIENIRLAFDNGIRIKPEKTTVLEAEAGWQASDTLYAHLNSAVTNIEHPIVFYTDTTASPEKYANFSQTGTVSRGAGLRWKSGAARLSLDYACYSARTNRVGKYAVPGRGSWLLAFPRHKVVLGASLPAGGGLSVNPSAIYYSRRYAWSGTGMKTYGELVLADLNFRLKGRPFSRLTLDLGVKDLFNSRYSYLQPYDGGHAPLPAPSREFFLKAAYDF